MNGAGPLAEGGSLGGRLCDCASWEFGTWEGDGQTAEAGSGSVLCVMCVMC